MAGLHVGGSGGHLLALGCFAVAMCSVSGAITSAPTGAPTSSYPHERPPGWPRKGTYADCAAANLDGKCECLTPRNGNIKKLGWVNGDFSEFRVANGYSGQKYVSRQYVCYQESVVNSAGTKQSDGTFEPTFVNMKAQTPHTPPSYSAADQTPLLLDVKYHDVAADLGNNQYKSATFKGPGNPLYGVGNDQSYPNWLGNDFNCGSGTGGIEAGMMLPELVNGLPLGNPSSPGVRRGGAITDVLSMYNWYHDSPYTSMYDTRDASSRDAKLKPIAMLRIKCMVHTYTPIGTSTPITQGWYLDSPSDAGNPYDMCSCEGGATECLSQPARYVYKASKFDPLGLKGPARKGPDSAKLGLESTGARGHQMGAYTQNFFFTSHFATEFNYVGHEYFMFLGDDDVWVYVNGVLVLDIGGIHQPRCRRIDLSHAYPSYETKAGDTFIRETLCNWPFTESKYSFAKSDGTIYDGDHPITLVPGGTYSLDIFHAERCKSGSSFQMETDMKLRPVTPKGTLDTCFQVSWDHNSNSSRPYPADPNGPEYWKSRLIHPVDGWTTTHPKVKLGVCGARKEGAVIPLIDRWSTSWPASKDELDPSCIACCDCTFAFDAKTCKGTGQVWAGSAFYAYGYPKKSSSNMGVEVPQTSMLLLVRDEDLNVYLIVNHDSRYNWGGENKWVRMEIQSPPPCATDPATGERACAVGTMKGLGGQGVYVQMRDDYAPDSTSCLGALKDCYAWNSKSGNGTFTWEWTRSDGDGMVLGPLPVVTGEEAEKGFEFVVKYTDSRGLYNFKVGDYNSNDHTVLPLDITHNAGANYWRNSESRVKKDVYVKRGIRIRGVSCTHYCELITHCGQCTVDPACGWCAHTGSDPKCLPTHKAELCTAASAKYPGGEWHGSGCFADCDTRCALTVNQLALADGGCSACVAKGCGFKIKNPQLNKGVNRDLGECLPGNAVSACDAASNGAPLFVSGGWDSGAGKVKSFTSVDIKNVQLDHSAGWTLEAWVLPESSNSRPMFTIKAPDGDICFHAPQVFSRFNINGKWHHVALVYDKDYVAATTNPYYPRTVVCKNETLGQKTIPGGAVRQNTNLLLQCEAGGSVMTGVEYASYGNEGGNDGGTCETFQAGSCDKDVRSYIAAKCVGRASCTVRASDSTFGGDPCPGVWKRLAVRMSGCEAAPYVAPIQMYVDGSLRRSWYGKLYGWNVAGQKAITVSPAKCVVDLPSSTKLTLSISSGADPNKANPSNYGYGVWFSTIVLFKGIRSPALLRKDMNDLGCANPWWSNVVNVAPADNPEIVTVDLDKIFTDKLFATGTAPTTFTMTLPPTPLTASDAPTLTVTANDPVAYPGPFASNAIGADTSITTRPGCRDTESAGYKARWKWATCTTPYPTPSPTSKPTPYPSNKPTVQPTPFPVTQIDSAKWPNCPADPPYSPLKYTLVADERYGTRFSKPAVRGCCTGFASRRRNYGGRWTKQQCEARCSAQGTCVAYMIYGVSKTRPFGYGMCSLYYPQLQGGGTYRVEGNALYNSDPSAAYNATRFHYVRYDSFGRRYDINPPRWWWNGWRKCYNQCKLDNRNKNVGDVPAAGCTHWVWSSREHMCYRYSTPQPCPVRYGGGSGNSEARGFVSGGRHTSRPDCGSNLGGTRLINKNGGYNCRGTGGRPYPNAKPAIPYAGSGSGRVRSGLCNEIHLSSTLFSPSMECQKRCADGGVNDNGNRLDRACAGWSLSPPETTSGVKTFKCTMYTGGSGRGSGMLIDDRYRYNLAAGFACGIIQQDDLAYPRVPSASCGNYGGTSSTARWVECYFKDAKLAPVGWPRGLPSKQRRDDQHYATKIKIFNEPCTAYKKCAGEPCDQVVSNVSRAMGGDANIWTRLEHEGMTVCEAAAEGYDDGGTTFELECRELCEKHACWTSTLQGSYAGCQTVSAFEYKAAANTVGSRGPREVPLFPMPASLEWPDFASDQLTFNVTGGALGNVFGVSRVDVRFHGLRHSRVSDVKIRLRSPDNQWVTILAGDNTNPCAANHFGGLAEYCANNCLEDARWYVGMTRGGVVSNYDRRCLKYGFNPFNYWTDSVKGGCKTREFQRLALGSAYNARYGGTYTFSSTGGTPMGCVSNDQQLGGNVQQGTIKVASMQRFVGAQKKGAGKWTLELGDTVLGNVGFFEHVELILFAESTDIPASFSPEAMTLALQPTTNVALSVDSGGLPLNPSVYLGVGGAGPPPAPATSVEWQESTNLWLSNTNENYIYYKQAFNCFPQQEIVALHVTTLTEALAAPPKPEARVQDIRASTLTLRWVFEPDARRRRLAVSDLRPGGPRVVSVGDTLEVDLNPASAASYLCWTSGAASATTATCAATHAAAGSASPEIKASTTGSGPVCGDEGMFTAEWVDSGTPQLKISVIECTALNTPVGNAMEFTLKLSAEHPVMIWMTGGKDAAWRVYPEPASGSSHSLTGLIPGDQYSFKVQGIDGTSGALGKVSEPVDAHMCARGCIDCAPGGICLECNGVSVLKDNMCPTVLLEGCDASPTNFKYGDGHIKYSSSDPTARTGLQCQSEQSGVDAGKAVCRECSLCPVGAERVECGGFSPGVCRQCRPNFFKSIVGELTAVVTLPRVSASEPCLPCTVCRNASYAAVECRTTSDTVCAPCPPDSFSMPGSVGLSSCICDAGFYRDGEVCTVCPFEPEKCDRCSPKGCMKCKSPYYVKEGKCVDSCGEDGVEYAGLIDPTDPNSGLECKMCQQCALGFGLMNCADESAGACEYCQHGTWRDPKLAPAQDCNDCLGSELLDCPVGDYASINCFGAQDKVCSMCQGCAPGAFRDGCNGTSAGKCLGCPDGSFKDWKGSYEDRCTPCWECASNMYKSSPCTPEGDTGMCLDCTPCVTGQYEKAACGDGHNTVCKACQSCAAGWEPLQDNGVIVCGLPSKPTDPGACVPCQPGFFKPAAVSSSAGDPNTGDASNIPAPWNQMCTAVTPCAKDEFAYEAATASIDNVCKPCAGFGRNGVDWWTDPATQSCEACTKCEDTLCDDEGEMVPCKYVNTCTQTSNSLCGLVELDPAAAAAAKAKVEAEKAKTGAALGILIPLGLLAVLILLAVMAAAGLGALMTYNAKKKNAALETKLAQLEEEERLEDELEREMKMKMGSGGLANTFSDDSAAKQSQDTGSRKSMSIEFVDDGVEIEASSGEAFDMDASVESEEAFDLDGSDDVYDAASALKGQENRF